MRIQSVFYITAVLLFSSLSVLAQDKIFLKKGGVIEGKVISFEKEVTIKNINNGDEVKYRASKVSKIILSKENIKNSLAPIDNSGDLSSFMFDKNIDSLVLTRHKAISNGQAQKQWSVKLLDKGKELALYGTFGYKVSNINFTGFDFTSSMVRSSGDVDFHFFFCIGYSDWPDGMGTPRYNTDKMFNRSLARFFKDCEQLNKLALEGKYKHHTIPEAMEFYFDNCI